MIFIFKKIKENADDDYVRILVVFARVAKWIRRLPSKQEIVVSNTTTGIRVILTKYCFSVFGHVV